MDQVFNLEQMLSEAAHVGCLPIVKYLVEKDVNVNSRFPANKVGTSSKKVRTPLHRASIAGHTEVVAFLLTRGAKHNVVNGALHTPLDQAVINNRIEVVKQLVAAGAEVDQKNTTRREIGALYVAIKNSYDEILEIIIPSLTRIERLTITLGRIRNLNCPIRIKQLLYERLQSLSRLSEDKLQQVYYFAIEDACEELVEILLNAGLVPNPAQKLVERAIRKGNSLIAQHILKTSSFDLNHLLREAAIKADVIIVKELLEQGADPQTLTNQDHSLFHKAIEEKEIGIVKLLLQQGILAKPSCSYKVPLHIAVSTGNLEMAKLLVDAGADVNEKSYAIRNTALSLAIERKAVFIIKYLICRGADIGKSHLQADLRAFLMRVSEVDHEETLSLWILVLLMGLETRFGERDRLENIPDPQLRQRVLGIRAETEKAYQEMGLPTKDPSEGLRACFYVFNRLDNLKDIFKGTGETRNKPLWREVLLCPGSVGIPKALGAKGEALRQALDQGRLERSAVVARVRTLPEELQFMICQWLVQPFKLQDFTDKLNRDLELSVFPELVKTIYCGFFSPNSRLLQLYADHFPSEKNVWDHPAQERHRHASLLSG